MPQSTTPRSLLKVVGLVAAGLLAIAAPAVAIGATASSANGTTTTQTDWTGNGVDYIGSKMGNNVNGSWHFFTPGYESTPTAYVTWTPSGRPGNPIVTISSCNDIMTPPYPSTTYPTY